MMNRTYGNLAHVPVWCICFLFLTAFTTTNGCKSRRATDATTETVAATTSLNAATLQQRAMAAFKNTHTSCYAHIQGETESAQLGNMDFSGNIYWERDQKIWVTLRKFGFEGMRVLITPDSCIVLNRLEKTALIRDAAWLESQYGIADGFAMLQAMLTNAPYDVAKSEKSAAIQDSLHLLTQRQGDRVLRSLMSEGDYRLQRVEIQELRRQINVSCTFADWAEAGSRGFAARTRQIAMQSPSEGQNKLTLRLNEVSFDEKKSVKFEIPAHYERI
jgi:Domain of unknown function (DUF4292)